MQIRLGLVMASGLIWGSFALEGQAAHQGNVLNDVFHASREQSLNWVRECVQSQDLAACERAERVFSFGNGAFERDDGIHLSIVRATCLARGETPCSRASRLEQQGVQAGSLDALLGMEGFDEPLALAALADATAELRATSRAMRREREASGEEASIPDRRASTGEPSAPERTAPASQSPPATGVASRQAWPAQIGSTELPFKHWYGRRPETVIEGRNLFAQPPFSDERYDRFQSDDWVWRPTTHVMYRPSDETEARPHFLVMACHRRGCRESRMAFVVRWSENVRSPDYQVSVCTNVDWNSSWWNVAGRHDRINEAFPGCDVDDPEDMLDDLYALRERQQERYARAGSANEGAGPAASGSTSTAANSAAHRRRDGEASLCQGYRAGTCPDICTANDRLDLQWFEGVYVFNPGNPVSNQLFRFRVGIRDDGTRGLMIDYPAGRYEGARTRNVSFGMVTYEPEYNSEPHLFSINGTGLGGGASLRLIQCRPNGFQVSQENRNYYNQTGTRYINIERAPEYADRFE